MVPLLKIFPGQISGNSIELHSADLSEILLTQNISENLFENLSQKDFRKVNGIEPLYAEIRSSYRYRLLLRVISTYRHMHLATHYPGYRQEHVLLIKIWSSFTIVVQIIC